MSALASSPRDPNAGDHLDLRAVYYQLRERTWLLGLCLLLALSGTVAYLLRAPKIYASKVVVQVEHQEAKVLNIERIQQEQLQSIESLKTVEQTLKSRTLLERVLLQNKLDQDPRFIGPTPDGPATREQLITALAGMMDAKLRKGTRLIDVTVEHPVPALTAVIANSLVKEYLRQNFEQNASASDIATEFLHTESKSLKRKLEESENALQAYREKSKTASLEEQQNTVVQKLKELSARVTEAESQRIVQETAFKQVQEIGDVPEKLLMLPAVANDPRVLEIRSNIARLESEIANLKQRYLQKHPKLLQAQSQLEEWNNSLTKAALNVPQTIRTGYESAKAAEVALNRALREQEGAALELNRQAIRYNQLLRDVESDRTLYSAVINRIKETSVTKEIQPSKVRIIQQASVPELPIKPNKVRVAFLGLFAGLALGAALVGLLTALDRSLKTVDQAEDYLELPVLATVPRLAEERDGNQRLIQSQDSKSAEAEAFRTLRTSLSMLGRKENRRTFLFTSAIPSEGKTFCSLNYAASLAQQGLKTLVIDGDLRRPMVEKSLRPGQPRSFGVTDYLTDAKPFDAIVHPTELDNFFFIPAGTHAPNPAELLAKTGIEGLINEALKQFDRVIVDSAPIHAVSDTLLMLEKIQTVCLVVRCRKTAKNAVKRAVQLLQEAEAPLAGVIMNYMPRVRGGGYYYDSYYHYSYYGYYTDQEKKDRKVKAKEKEKEKVAA